MQRYAYLVYVTDAFHLAQRPRFFLRRHGEAIKEVSGAQLGEVNATIVSYHLDELVSYCPGSHTIRLNSLVDISSVARLLQGTKHDGSKGDEPWNIWNLVSKAGAKNDEVRTMRGFLYAGERDLSPSVVESCVSRLSQLVERLWTELRKDLREKGEDKRYFQIEKPVLEILLRQQAQGIRVDQKVLLRTLDKIDEEIGFAGNVLRDRWNVREPFDDCEVRSALEAAGLFCLAEQIESTAFDSVLDLHAQHHDLPRYLRLYKHYQKDKSILLRLGAVGSDRIYPLYNTIGTVTGRILLESPGLQYLKKEHRSLIISDPEMSLLYPDYSQFEPGIMADDSRDSQLIEDYNAGDLYLALSNTLFGSPTHRDSGKVLFLAFSYGMDDDRMAHLAAEVCRKKAEDVREILRAFFGKYHTLRDWRHRLQDELLASGRVGTHLGNFRYRTSSENGLSSQERRWACSQRVQGTASLILKRTIINIAHSRPEANILVPMHDALLLQVPSAKSKELKSDIGRAFVEEFKRECPRIRPRVVFTDFAERTRADAE